jgi:hypothetical protein
LRRSVIAGDFERDRQCRVLYLHPSGVRSKMTRERMRNVSKTLQHSTPTVERQYLACCWIPRSIAIFWCITHGVSMAGWLGGALPVKGRPPIDDELAVDAMAVLCKNDKGLSDRKAAERVAKAFGKTGNRLKADIERWRHKYAERKKKTAARS